MIIMLTTSSLMNVALYTILLVYIGLSVNATTTDYMTAKCGAIVRVDSWRILESALTLTYPPRVRCQYSVTTAPGSRVMVLVRRLQLEHAIAGSCSDFVNFHDGLDTNAATLNSEPLCGTVYPPFNVSSSGDSLTVAFTSDNTAQDRGFDLIFVSFTTGQCGANQFSCNNHICISSQLACDTFNQCGDNSDEQFCPEITTQQPDTLDVGLIAGVCAGLVIAIVTALIAFALYRHFRWKRLLSDTQILSDVALREPESPYPVTWRYWREPILVGTSSQEFKWGVRNAGYVDLNIGKLDHHCLPSENPVAGSSIDDKHYFNATA